MGFTAKRGFPTQNQKPPQILVKLKNPIIRSVFETNDFPT